MSDATTTGTSTVCFVEIPAPDLDAAQRFYSTMFGWEILTGHSDNYILWKAGDLTGGFDAAASPGGNSLVVYLKVENIPEKLSEIEAVGGGVLSPKTEIPAECGYLAHFRDPNGNIIGLWSKD